MYKIFKKVISFIVCLVVCLALMPSFAIAASKPAPPKGLKGTALSTSSIKLSWKKVKKAKKYIIYRKYGSKFKKMATTRKTSYTVKKLKAGTRYSFKVAVKTAKGTSKQSAAKKVITKKASTPDPENPVASLPAPKNLRTTSVSRSQINLIWDVVSGAAKYNIYFSASVSGQYSKITESSANTFSLSGLTANTNYYFKVSAIDVSGKEGALTNPLTIKTAADPGVQKLPAPSNLRTTSVSQSQINLAWDAVTGAVKYNVYYATSVSGQYSKITESLANAFSLSGLTENTNYYFKVSAIDVSNTEGDMSGPLTAKTSANPGVQKLPAPSNLRTTSVSQSQINLAWDAVTGAVKYNVYYATSVTGQYSKIIESSANTASHTELAANTDYYYKVAAVDASNTEGNMSGPLTAKTSADPGGQKLPAPANLRATSVSQSQINLAWDAVTGAVKYNVYYATSVTGQYSKIIESSASTAAHTGLAANTDYYYKVAAVDASNTEGNMSGSLTAKTSADPGGQKLSAPSNLRTTSVSQSQINLAWDAVTGAVKYNVYYATSVTGQYSKIIESSASTAAHTGLAANTDYYYKVAAVDASNTEGNMSGPLTAKTSADPGAQKLPAPVNLRQIYKDHESIGLAWDAVPNAVRYNIYVAVAAAGPYEWFDWGDTEVLVQELQPSTSYYFKVAAVDINGQEGVQSGFITQMTNARPAAAAAPSFAIYGYTYPSPAGSGYMRVHFQRQAAGNTTYASGSTVTIRQYYSTDKGKNWILEDDTRDAGWSGFDPEFYMDFPLGSTRASKFTLVINNVESLACVINPYAILPPCPKYSGQTYPTMYRSAIEYSNRYGPGDPAVFGLKWNSVPGAAGYDVYMNTVGGYSFTMYLLTSTSGTSISCRYSTWNNQNIIKPTVWGPQYFVKIFARNSEGYQSPFCTYSTVIMTCNDAANDWHGFSY